MNLLRLQLLHHLRHLLYQNLNFHHLHYFLEKELQGEYFQLLHKIQEQLLRRHHRLIHLLHLYSGEQLVGYHLLHRLHHLLMKLLKKLKHYQHYLVLLHRLHI